MKQLSYHWTDFREIWYLRIFEDLSNKIQVLLNLDKNNGYFMYMLDIILLNS